ncbi:MAG: quinolinate synthase NadA [Candidatus Eisenbacteria bacterium]|nr:quinolinate synthase NadA [Candidatus Eisenbacteria bacterium]
MEETGSIIPEKYLSLSVEETAGRITRRRKELGHNLVILAHHYQRKELVDLSDFRGDSYGLSRRAAQQEAEFIVFCGVHFMAESADILTRDDQKIYLPNMAAGCPMAEMAQIGDVENAWEGLEEILGPNLVSPIVYVNSNAELKAFCGKRGGAVCTSSNARALIEWGLRQREKVLFFPDEHLGRNTAKRLGIAPGEIALWDPDLPLGGNTAEQIMNARIFLWKGYCHVHTWFSTEHVTAVREAYPQAKIVVHPECRQEVVDMVDGCGSTEFIVNYVSSAPKGSVVVVGTEINLVNRLASENPDKVVFELARSLCPNMFRINSRNLLWTLESLNEVNRVRVDPSLKADARVALERMLRISETRK